MDMAMEFEEPYRSNSYPVTRELNSSGQNSSGQMDVRDVHACITPTFNAPPQCVCVPLLNSVNGLGQCSVGLVPTAMCSCAPVLLCSCA